MGIDFGTPSGGMTHFIGKIIIRSLQFLMAIVTAGLYSVHLDAQHKAGDPYDGQFVFAVVIAAVSALTTVIYGIPLVKSHVLWVWDAVLFLNWITVFGVFGKLFLHRPDGDEYAYQGTHTTRMRHAVWVDLFNALLWFTTAIYGAVVFWKARRAAKINFAPAMPHVSEV